MSQLADIVRCRTNNKLFMIVDIESFNMDHYLFHLYDFSSTSCESWFEPFNKQLSNQHWETLT